MKEIYFITKNQKKIDNARHALEPLGYKVNIVKIETPEIQAKDESEVAKYSAKWAASQMNKPVIVNDMGFYINSLNGFPGVYARYAYYTIGVAGVLKMLEGKEDRSAYLKMTLAYCEPEKEPICFEVSTHGTIALEEPEEKGCDWDYIFIPDDVKNNKISKEEWYYWSYSIYKDLSNYLKNKK